MANLPGLTAGIVGIGDARVDQLRLTQMVPHLLIDTIRD